jgi:hypothetical protein
MSVDTAFYGGCSEDPLWSSSIGRPSLSTTGTTNSHPGQPGHAGHCFCHALSINLASHVTLVRPDNSLGLIARMAEEPPDAAPRDLDHPPQLSA